MKQIDYRNITALLAVILSILFTSGCGDSKDKEPYFIHIGVINDENGLRDVYAERGNPFNIKICRRFALGYPEGTQLVGSETELKEK